MFIKKPEVAVDKNCKLGEGPLWNPLDNCLYFLDIIKGIIFRYIPQKNQLKEVYNGDVIGGFTIQKDGSLLLFMEKGIIKKLENGKTTTIIKGIPALSETRFNDVIVDPEGRVFCGTMPDKNEEAFLYRLDTNGEIRLILDNIGLANGMGFTFDKKNIYLTDTGKNKIYIFDYNNDDGSLSNKRIFLDVEEDGLADGLTVDNDGYVWSARWDGGCVKRFTPEGKLDMKVDFPAKKITSMTFGGNNYKDLFITSAGGDKRPMEGQKAGSLFKCSIKGIRGLPEFFSKICI